MAEARMMHVVPRFIPLAPDADIGFIYVGLCPERGTTIMVDLAGHNVSYHCNSLGNHVQVVTGGALESYYVAVYFRGSLRLDLVVFRFNLVDQVPVPEMVHLFSGDPVRRR